MIAGANYENLFATYDILSGNVRSEPPSNSLFNLNNFQMLVDLGMSTGNIMANTSLIYGVDFQLTDQWDQLTQ